MPKSKALTKSVDLLHEKLDSLIVTVAGGQDPKTGKPVRGHHQRIEDLEDGHRTSRRALWTAGAAAVAVVAKSAWDALRKA